LNLDQLNNAPMSAVTNTTFRLVDAMQSQKEGTQALACGLLFVLLCEAKGVTPGKVLQTVSNLRAQLEDTPDELTVLAIRDYIEEELNHG
jgi:hypothetical protein